jgi:3-hydroxy-9,10-secoandrosta-1,3,5(10)-triene-9,17-dione monooxygenase
MGSGSKDVVIEGCYVPYERICSLTQVLMGKSPGLEINTSPLYQQGFFAPSACTLVAPACGAALGMLDHFTEKMTSRVLVFGAGNQVEKVASQIRLVEAESEIDTGELLLERDSAEFKQLALDGKSSTPEKNARAWYNNSYATTLFTRAADRLYAVSGGAALQSDNPIQRFWRDIHAINNHGGLNFDTNAEIYARVKLGMPVESPLIG